MPIESLADLETFVAIVDSGSFTAAAKRQGLTVNAVSRRLQQLEESLGTKLIERTTRRSTPTDAGRRLHEKAPAVFEALVQAEAETQQSKVAIEGVVRVALPPAVVTHGLLREFERLLNAHPRLRIDLRVAFPHPPGEAGVDVTVVTEAPPATHNLISRSIVVHGWGLAASPGYVKAHGLPRSPAALSNHACLRFVGEAPQRTWTLSGPRERRVVVKVNGVFESDDSRVLGDAIYAGLGIGVRPESEILEGVQRKALVHVLPGWRFGVKPAYLVTTAGRRGLPRVAAVSDIIAAAIRGLA
jgi:DNA-binding transcriptional LysR family regulator